jgi:hypothetical protein
MHYIVLQITFSPVQPCAVNELKTQWWVNGPLLERLLAGINVVEVPSITPGAFTDPVRSSLEQTFSSVLVKGVAVQEQRSTRLVGWKPPHWSCSR